jgi:cell division protein FtsW
LGEGRQKYYFLPKLHKDFIFATVGEEFGFAGCLVILLLYLVLLYRGAIVVGLSTTTSYGQYLATGITVVIFLYSLVHEAVTLGMIPTTGQPLPFISYGGSALIANLFGAGVVLRISRFKRSGLDEGADRGGWYRRTRVPGARTGI